MPNYRSPISKEKFHWLEIYFFRLMLYTETDEFRGLKAQMRDKIVQEINYMTQTLSILEHLFVPEGNNEKPVVGWRVGYKKKKYEKEGDDPGYEVIYRFSCVKTAAAALDLNRNKLSMVINGIRPHTGGYKFVFEEEYESDLEFDPENSTFEFKNTDS